MKSLKEVLMARDGMTSKEADEAIDNAKNAFYDLLETGGDPEDFLMNEFGLEDDYIMDLID